MEHTVGTRGFQDKHAGIMSARGRNEDAGGVGGRANTRNTKERSSKGWEAMK